ncbi:MAG: N-acetyltransferase [Chloroflexi bacterium]|nr:MAG: N-acetyltransferase [Chloroflexota bacterium]
MKIVLETERLRLREMSTSDAKFMLALLNEPAFIKNIGDKGVRNLEDAKHYILEGPAASYEQNGFGLYLVELKVSHTPIGMCGLVNRDSLDDVDVGYAFMPDFWSKGYAVESAAAIMTYGKDTLELDRIVGITASDNAGSIKVLKKIGLTFDRMITLPGDDEEIMLFS